MYTSFTIIGTIILFAGFIASRIMSERALKHLTAEEKVTLLDSFSRLRAYSGLPAVIIVMGFFFTDYLPENLIWTAYFILWGLLGLYMVILHRLVVGRLRFLGVSLQYQKAHLRARYVSYAGFIGFFIFFTLSPFFCRG